MARLMEVLLPTPWPVHMNPLGWPRTGEDRQSASLGSATGMVAQVIFSGGKVEQAAFLAALARWCECTADEFGATVVRCTVHEAMLDQRFVDHMCFARTLRLQLEAEEFSR